MGTNVSMLLHGKMQIIGSCIYHTVAACTMNIWFLDHRRTILCLDCLTCKSSVIVGLPAMVPDIGIDNSTININEDNVTLTLNWGEPFNNFDPIVNYTVSCSGDVTCPPNFTTTDNTTRSYTIANLTTMTNYTFSVVATNSIGREEAGVANITTPGEVIMHLHMFTVV